MENKKNELVDAAADFSKAMVSEDPTVRHECFKKIRKEAGIEPSLPFGMFGKPQYKATLLSTLSDKDKVAALQKMRDEFSFGGQDMLNLFYKNIDGEIRYYQTARIFRPVIKFYRFIKSVPARISKSIANRKILIEQRKSEKRMDMAVKILANKVDPKIVPGILNKLSPGLTHLSPQDLNAILPELDLNAPGYGSEGDWEVQGNSLTIEEYNNIIDNALFLQKKVQLPLMGDSIVQKTGGFIPDLVIDEAVKALTITNTVKTPEEVNPEIPTEDNINKLLRVDGFVPFVPEAYHETLEERESLAKELCDSNKCGCINFGEKVDYKEGEVQELLSSTSTKDDTETIKQEFNIDIKELPIEDAGEFVKNEINKIKMDQK